MTTDATISDPAREMPPAGQAVDLDALAARRAGIAATYLKPTGERPPSTTRGIHHVALLCSDVERTVKFYDGVLGFPLVQVMENRDYRGSTHFFFDLGQGNLLAFFDFPGLDLGHYAEVLGGLHHLAISISPRKWEAARARLERAGIPHTVHSDVSLYFPDPDGARMELIADPLGELYGTDVL
jgi:catechol 2,3-dioxygenase-like lactoylglutathione lyase family enzyme